MESAAYLSYNVTCLKGGYTTQISQSVIEFSDAVPNVRQLNITPSVAYTNSSLTCNINVTDGNDATLTINVSWFVDEVKIFNTTGITYTQGTGYYHNLSLNE